MQSYHTHSRPQVANPHISRILWVVVFLVIIAGATALQAFRIDYPVTSRSGDGSRDYLIARHIVEFGELPLLGPANGGTGGAVPNSPAYFYLLAGFVAINDDIVFLEAIGLLLWALGALCMFLFASRIFGLLSGFAGGSLYILSSLSQINPAFGLWHSSYIWQPIFMTPFLALAAYLLARAYQGASLRFLLSGIAVATFAVAIHTSALFFLPLVLTGAFFTLYKQKAGTLKFLSVTAFLFCGILFWYLPPLLSAILNGTPFLPSDSSFFSALWQNLTSLPRSLPSVSSELLSPFMRLIPLSPSKTQTAVIAFLIASAFYLSPLVKRTRKAKVLIAGLAATTFLQVAAVALLPAPQAFYFLALHGFLAVAAGEVMVGLSKQHWALKLLGLSVIAMALQLSPSSIAFQVFASDNERGQNRHIVESAASGIAKDVRELQTQEEFLKPDFFRLGSFYRIPLSEGNILEPLKEAVLWAPLERKLGTKLVRIETFNAFALLLTPNRDDYIYLACYEHSRPLSKSADPEWCFASFLERATNHAIEKEVYRSPFLSVWRTKRVTEGPPVRPSPTNTGLLPL